MLLFIFQSVRFIYFTTVQNKTQPPFLLTKSGALNGGEDNKKGIYSFYTVPNFGG